MATTDSTNNNDAPKTHQKKSTHRVEVVPVVLKPHPDADNLCIVDVYNYQVVVRKDEWSDATGDNDTHGGSMLGAYVPPDSVVPDSEVFSFLKNLPANRRIRVSKLRGVWSQGVLCKAPKGSKLGDDVSDILGVTRYVPPVPTQPGEQNEEAPPAPADLQQASKTTTTQQKQQRQEGETDEGGIPVYDVETWHRYGALFTEGEQVSITEKIHGANGRFHFSQANNRMYCGSRTHWKKFAPQSIWWACLKQNPWIEKFCKANPNLIVYGEVYGAVQDLTYGCKKGQYKFSAFDLYDWHQQRFLSWNEVKTKYLPDAANSGLVWAPLLYEGPYNAVEARKLADGTTEVPHAKGLHIREGIVVKPVEERSDPEIGRVVLKIVSDQYLLKAK